MYPPSHPWYYRENAPLPVDKIPSADASIYDDLPRTRKKLAAELAQTRACLKQDIARYQDPVANGETALSPPELMYGHPRESLHDALALKHNHIAYNKGLILVLEEALGPEQGTLF